MNADVGSVIAVVVVVALIVWGLLPGRRKTQDVSAPAHPLTPSPADDAQLARKVGVVTGLTRGSVKDAAATKYALSRLDHPPTHYDIGVAAGVESTQRGE